MDGDWRMACVTRARTVAGGVRFVEFALSGAPILLEAGATVDIVIGPRGAIHTFACLPAEPGSLRVLVPRGATAAARFMWALVEGAHMRGRLSGPGQPEPVRGRAPAVRGLSTVRLAIEAPASRLTADPATDPAGAGGSGIDALRAEVIAFPLARRVGVAPGPATTKDGLAREKVLQYNNILSAREEYR